MSGPAQVDQALWQGDDTPPLVWGFGPVGSSEIPVGAQFRLDIAWETRGVFAPTSGSITATSPSGCLVVDQPGGTVTWFYTTDQSASVPRGAVAGYTLRCLYASATQTWAQGRIVARSALPVAITT